MLTFSTHRESLDAALCMGTRPPFFTAILLALAAVDVFSATLMLFRL
jgi:hypothetical protein